ncbi:MAG: fibronectin type III domain-containing protein [bacterium]
MRILKPKKLLFFVITFFLIPLYIFAGNSDVYQPLITISGVSEGCYYSTSVYPEISISDEDLAYSTATLKFNNSKDSAYVRGTEIKKDGRYRISVSAFDSSGNKSYESVNFVIDKTKPAITIYNVENDTYYTTDVWFKVKIAESNPEKELITLDDNIRNENETVWVRDEGIHKLVVDTLDRAGNANLKSCVFTINKTSPVILSHEPFDTKLRIKEGEKIDFWVSVFDPDNNIIKSEWYFDSIIVCEGVFNWTFYAGYDDSGRHEVKFIAADSNLAVENAWDIEVDDVPVRPPLNLIAGTGTGGHIFLKWDENKYFNLLGYNIYRDDKKINRTLVTKNHYLDTGLIDGTEYSYFIRAMDINGKESENSNKVSVIPEDSSAPSAPANPKVNDNGLLLWEKPSDYDIAGYYLYQGVDNNNLDNKIEIAGAQIYRSDTPSYQLSNLTPGIQYYFALSCYDFCNKESEKSDIVSYLFYDSLPPCRVKDVRTRNTGNSGELKIRWLKNSEPDLAGYKIYCSAAADLSAGVETGVYPSPPVFAGMSEKFTLSGLEDFKKYSIAVSAVDTQENEGLKSPVEIGIPSGNSGLVPAPEYLTVDSGNKEAALSWSPVPGADGYKVYFGRQEHLVISPLITKDTVFVFNNLLNNNRYYAAVSSFKGRDESELIAGTAFPENGSYPDAPAGLTCLSGGDTNLLLSWSMNKEWDLAGYKIAYKKETEYFEEPKDIGKTNWFEITGLTEGEKYTIALFAFDNENNMSNPSVITGVPLKTSSDYSNPPPAPLLDISCENGIIRLNWTSSGVEIDEYRIYRREAGEPKYKKIYETKNLTYKNKAVEEGRTYYYVVTAFRESSFPGESLFSNEVIMRPKVKMGDIEMEGDVPVESRVDGYDLIILSISFGSKTGDDYYNPNVDLNGDGIIDGTDLNILAGSFGKEY